MAQEASQKAHYGGAVSINVDHKSFSDPTSLKVENFRISVALPGKGNETSIKHLNQENTLIKFDITRAYEGL